MTCTEEYREPYRVHFPCLLQSRYPKCNDQRSEDTEQEAQKKYPLNTLQKKVLQYYKNKSLYHFGKKRYIIAETTTIRSYGG